MAYLLKQIGETRTRFELWITSVAFGKGAIPATGFPPFIGLTALDDSDPTVRTAYKKWLAIRRSGAFLSDSPHWGARSSLATTESVLLGGGPKEEELLVACLKDQYNALHDRFKDDIPITNEEKSSEHVTERALNYGDDHVTVPSALDYMAALALAWLHSKRMADKNTPVTTKDFPKIPNITALQIAAVPEHVIQEINNRSEGSEKYKIRLEQINNTPKENKNGDLFSDTPVRKTEVPIPLVPKAQYDIPPKVDRVIVVKESDRDVYTGITLQNGDVYEFSDISHYKKSCAHR